jgi:cell division protein ZapA (FtsZ GTPase activity inhibitor)
MSKAIKLVIGGKEYTLKGEDEKLTRLAAEEVNAQVEALKGRHLEESSNTLSVLAALNIAEKYHRSSRSKENERRLIINEMESMAEFLAGRLRKDSY